MPVDSGRITNVVKLAATRGPHSHGYAWVGKESLCFDRGWGDAKRAIPDLVQLDTHALIGHSRLATTGLYAGGPPELKDTMPFVVEDDDFGVAIVHNGTVRKFAALARRHGFDLATGCDSEIIAHLLHRAMAQAPTLPLSALLMLVADEIDEGNPFAVVALASNGEVAAVRRSLPLFAANGENGTYLCSRAFDGSVKLRDGYAWGWPTFTARECA